MIASNTSVYTVENCAFSYDNKPALKNINLKIETGHFYGVIGPNGSGKTTLLDLLLGLKNTTSGSVKFNNHALSSYSKRELAKNIAAVPQEFALSFDFSVYDVVMMGRHPYTPRFGNPTGIDHELVEQNLKLLNIWKLRTQPANMLSGGEKQRVVVARALTQDCPVLLLDEATSNLDIQHTIDIMRIIRDKVKKQNITVIASIHDLNLASAFCDKIIALNEGAIHAFGSTADVISANLIKDLFNVTASTHKTGTEKTTSVQYVYR